MKLYFRRPEYFAVWVIECFESKTSFENKRKKTAGTKSNGKERLTTASIVFDKQILRVLIFQQESGNFECFNSCSIKCTYN